jgi:hypothetical protein
MRLITIENDYKDSVIFFPNPLLFMDASKEWLTKSPKNVQKKKKTGVFSQP